MTVKELILKIDQHILNPIIILMFFVAVAIFIWGLAQFIGKSGDEAGRTTGKRNILYGLIGIVIMISVYGILQLVVDTFNIQTSGGASLQVQNYIQSK